MPWVRQSKYSVEEFLKLKFGRLTPLKLFRDVNRLWYWECQCECGAVSKAREYDLVNNRVFSCGCLRNEKTAKRATTHGFTANHACPGLYRQWYNMCHRCHNPRNTAYKRYGLVGITVCDRWRGEGGFANFLADMGDRPSPKHSIDRIDGSKGYSPENCRWATTAEQARNRKSNRFYTYQGVTLCAQDWANRLGIATQTMLLRFRKWSVEKAITTPVNRNLSRNQRKPSNDG